MVVVGAVMSRVQEVVTACHRRCIGISKSENFERGRLYVYGRLSVENSEAFTILFEPNAEKIRRLNSDQTTLAEIYLLGYIMAVAR
jgi:hypothetical protein